MCSAQFGDELQHDVFGAVEPRLVQFEAAQDRADLRFGQAGAVPETEVLAALIW